MWIQIQIHSERTKPRLHQYPFEFKEMDKHKETKHQQMNADSVEAVVEIDLEAIGSAWEKAKKKKLNANVNKLIEFETEENQSTNNAAHAQEKAAGKYSLQ
eukprot:123605_1